MLGALKLSLYSALLAAAAAPHASDARLVLWQYRVPSLSLARDFTATPAPTGICDDPVNAASPFCDASRSMDERVDDLVARVPLSAVGGLMIDNATELSATSPPVHLPAYPWWNEALHGVGDCVGVKFRGETPYATSFPQVVGVAASFNRTLFYRLGEAIGTEARAFYNAGNSGLTYWAPNVNIFRDPRWGRGQETPGEDPVLTSEYAVAFVRGMQGDPAEGEAASNNSTGSSGFLKVSATCKHFSSYSQEFARHRNDAIVTKQDQADTYFPMFEACIRRGRATGVMCSYNAVNGVPACADRDLLTGLVRETWGFDGYIMSDCGAVQDVVAEHHYTQSPLQTCAVTLNAGMDLNCGQFLQQHLVKALDQGIVKPEAVRTALKRLYRMQMRLGMFEKHPQPFADISSDQVDSAPHRSLALEAAQQSMVVLKNEGGLLPLSADSSVALVGPHFNGSTVFLGNYAGFPSSISTPLGAISKYAKTVDYAFGCNVSTSDHDFDKAEAVAKKADQVVLFIGIDQSQEREDLDRETIKLPGLQPELIDRVLKVATKPVVLVVVAGGCVDLSKYKNDPKVGAILFAGYPGQSGGQAIADVLYGAVNPSGRLTQTFYSEDFVETTSLYDMHMRPYEPTGNPGRTYRFYSGTPVFAFGEGLSYTSFKVEPSATATCDANGAWSAQVTVRVTNTGKRAGEFVALLFAVPPRDASQPLSTSHPLKSLVAFDRTRLLSAGSDDSQTLTFELSSAAFALADEHGQLATQPGTWELLVDGEKISLKVGEGAGCGVRLDKATKA